MHSIRALAHSDSLDVLRINQDSIPGVAALDPRELERLLAIPNVHLAAVDSTAQVIGYALAFRSSAPYDGEEFQALRATRGGPFLYVDQVAVKFSMRRHGVAGALYRVLEREAADRLLARLCCEVNLEPPNPDSLAFHRMMGFRQLAELATVDGRTVALMEKTLA